MKLTQRLAILLGMVCIALTGVTTHSAWAEGMPAEGIPQVIFSNIGSHGTDFSDTDAYGLYTYNSVAQSFTVTGSSFLLDSFQIPLSNDADTAYPLIVQISQSVNGTPGAVLETFSGILSAGPNSPQLYTFADSTGLELTQSNNYSISLYDPNQTSDALGAWFFSGTATTGLALSSDEGNSWFAFNGLPAAGLLVKGTPLAAPVPEASSLIALGMGLVVLAGMWGVAGLRHLTRSIRGKSC